MLAYPQGQFNNQMEGKRVFLEGFCLMSRQGLQLEIQISLSLPGLTIGNPDLPG